VKVHGRGTGADFERTCGILDKQIREDLKRSDEDNYLKRESGT
jgi:hypothetical protein